MRLTLHLLCLAIGLSPVGASTAALSDERRPTYDYAYEGDLSTEEIYRAKEEVAFMQAVVAASLANERGDAQAAYEAFLPLAEKGHPGAQYSVGYMWEHGKGVEPDLKEAVGWYQKSAEQDHNTAQLALGLMYKDGRGVPQDVTQAHMWLTLAARSGTPEAQEHKTALAADMNEQQLATSRRMVRAWLANREIQAQR